MARRSSDTARRKDPPPDQLRQAGSWRAAVILSAAVVTLAAAAWWLAPALKRGQTVGPVILISIDTLRADRLPVYGYDKVATPHIDALARDAVVFERAFAHSPQTLPSHASMLSGRLPFEHGVRDNLGFTVKPGETLLPAMLRERGFRSAGFVSAYVLRKDVGIGQGFDLFDAELSQTSATTSIGQVQRDGSLTLAAAGRWLATQPDGRFFLFFHTYDPHRPYEPPPRYAQYDPYDGEIAYSDEIVGKLVAQLKTQNLYDSATIIFVSDHGEAFGEHGEWEHGLFLYNETTHVPFIVKLPGSRNAGRRTAAPVQHIDIVPTVLEFVGAQAPAGLRGRSLVPVLADRGSLPEAGIYAEALYSRYHFGWSELYSLTDNRFRYIRAPKEELFDLESDFGERRNLASERAQTRTAMRGALDRLLAGSSIDSPSTVTAEEQERLKALGYVGSGPVVSPDVAGETLPDPKDKVDILTDYRRASDLVGQRRYLEAIPLYEKILAADPGMSDVWLTYAKVQSQVGDVAAALGAFRKAVEIDPSDSGAILAVGAVLMRMGKLEDAEAHARLATTGSPAAAHELLAKIAVRRGDAEAARREAALAQQADATLPMTPYVEGLLRYREGRYAEAEPYFRRAAEAMKARTLQLTDVHFHLGDTLARLERYPEAEAELKKEIALAPEEIKARSSLAMLYWAMERYPEAAGVINEILVVRPTPEGFARALRLWQMFGVDDQARAVERTARQRFGPDWTRRAGTGGSGAEIGG